MNPPSVSSCIVVVHDVLRRKNNKNKNVDQNDEKQDKSYDCVVRRVVSAKIYVSVGRARRIAFYHPSTFDCIANLNANVDLNFALIFSTGMPSTYLYLL